jgi:transposase InsO family protein
LGGDITEFATGDGRLYLAIVDLHDRSVVGWSKREPATTDLVIDALVMAMGRRRPEREVVHHSDRGSVYTSLRFANHLGDYRLVASFSSYIEAFYNRGRHQAGLDHRTPAEVYAEARVA